MPKAILPEQLDAIASAQDNSAQQTHRSVLTTAMAIEIVSRFVARPIERLPKKLAHRRVLLAALCNDLQRYRPYTETELNAHLQRQLSLLRASPDHATVRRALIDAGFIKRDRAGSRYYLNRSKLKLILGVECIEALSAFLQGLQQPD